MQAKDNTSVLKILELSENISSSTQKNITETFSQITLPHFNIITFSTDH